MSSFYSYVYEAVSFSYLSLYRCITIENMDQRPTYSARNMKHHTKSKNYWLLLWPNGFLERKLPPRPTHWKLSRSVKIWKGVHTLFPFVLWMEVVVLDWILDMYVTPDESPLVILTHLWHLGGIKRDPMSPIRLHNVGN